MRDEILVSATLRVGVALAALSSLVGAGLVYFSGHAGDIAAYATFHAVRVAPALTGFGLLSFGVSRYLIATPDRASGDSLSWCSCASAIGSIQPSARSSSAFCS